MDQEESFALYKQGKEAWNAWANELLVEKATLEANGEWKSEEQNWNDRAKITFNEHEFDKPIDFSGFIFPGYAGFSDATFSADANFTSAKFEGLTLFKSAHFIPNEGKPTGDTYYIAIRVTGYFSLQGTEFAKAPDFTQAHFQQAPSLDRVTIQTSKKREDFTQRWRALRRLATQGHDHENEKNFFAREIQSRRDVTDCWFGKNWQRRFFGHAYELFSDFGRSIWRPLMAWVLLTGVMGWGYLIQNSILKFGPHASLFHFQCFDSDANPIAAAANISLSRASVFGKLAGGNGLESAFHCLFGTKYTIITHNAPLVHIPGWVVFAGYGQSFFSAIFIFFVLLALRNQFRIR